MGVFMKDFPKLVIKTAGRQREKASTVTWRTWSEEKEPVGGE